MSSLKHSLTRALSLTLLALASTLPVAHASVEGPPTVDGVIRDPNLERNSDIAKAQAVGAITTFMTKGAQECDADGQNCRSVFGDDDTPDYNTMKFRGQATTGVESYSFQTEGQDSAAVATQMGTLALACSDSAVKMVAGVAIKPLECVVTTGGDVRMGFQVCTGPQRGNPIEPPENAVECSTNPSDSNYLPPQGMVCIRPACDTEPEGSLNGWSTPTSITWNSSLPDNASESDKSNNGLGMVFYPNPASATVLSFDTDSDNMTAVKVIQSFVNQENGQTAVGLRVAYRQKTQITKEMLTDSNSISNPSTHTAQWDTLTKLQGNAMIPQLQAEYAANGSECIQQITEGVAKDGMIYVCDQGYNNESGVRPIGLSAQVAAAGQDCGSLPQCLKEVVNTNTWTETCSAEVPLALRDCSTTQDYTIDKVSWTRTRTTEICHERRTTAEYSCNTWAEPSECRMETIIGQGGMDMISQDPDTTVRQVGWSADGLTGQYLYGTIADNYWSNGYYKRVFYVDIRNVDDVKAFRLYNVGFDDLMAISVNGHWIWSDYKEGFYNPEYDEWGRWNETRECRGTVDYDNPSKCNYCLQEQGGDAGGCNRWASQEEAWIVTRRQWQNAWELKTSWSYDVNVDFRPYLREGRNVIRIDTGVRGNGEGWAHFDISAYKPVCNTIVRNECATYEAAR